MSLAPSLYVVTRQSVEGRLATLQAEVDAKWAEVDAAQAHVDTLCSEAGHAQYHVDALKRQLKEMD